MTGLLERFNGGDRQALARILSNVEDQTDLGREALRRLTPRTGNAYLIGLTGPPGSGKSTLAHRLVQAYRERGQTVAVLAIDPSSPFTGGAALGDRIRMLESQDDPDVFLRSMASRGQVGGLALAAFGAALVLDAYGFDMVIIETVGTGQDEVEIASLADTVLLVETPGLGDHVQSVKAGILEIADIVAVNKADLPGAEDVVRDLRQAMRTSRDGDWRIPVLKSVAEDGSGIAELVETIAQHRGHRDRSTAHADRFQTRLVHHARMIALHRIDRWLREGGRSGSNEGSDPVVLADDMLDQFARERLSRSAPRSGS